MTAVIGTVPAQLTITVTAGDQEPVVIGTGSIEVKMLGTAAVVSSDTAGMTVAVDTEDARHELAQALREMADQLDAH